MNEEISREIRLGMFEGGGLYFVSLDFILNVVGIYSLWLRFDLFLGIWVWLKGDSYIGRRGVGSRREFGRECKVWWIRVGRVEEDVEREVSIWDILGVEEIGGVMV